MNRFSENLRRGVSDAGGRFSETLDEAEEAGEDCVRDNPESAVWTSFLGGLLLGTLIGWLIAEQREGYVRRLLRRKVSDMRNSLHLS